MEKKKVLCVIGGEAHDFQQTSAILQKLVQGTGRPALTVTEDRSQLSRLPGSEYDRCIFYTAVGTLLMEQTEGLVSFVREGKGFLGLHCASVISENNRDYIELLGSRFVGHSPH